MAQLKKRDATGQGEEDSLIRDQLILRLRNGQFTRASARPTLVFRHRKETLALEQDQLETIEQPACMAAGVAGSSTQRLTTEWKQELCAEIMQDIKNHMAELVNTLLNELCKTQPLGPSLPGARELVGHTRLGSSGVQRTDRSVIDEVQLDTLATSVPLYMLCRGVFSFSGHSG